MKHLQIITDTKVPEVGMVNHVWTEAGRTLVMEERNLFEDSNQLNQLFHKIIHCFKVLETPHAGDACCSKLYKCTKNMHKKGFYKPTANVFLKVLLNSVYNMCF